MLEKIKQMNFPTNMGLTTMQNLIYALSMMHSVTIVNNYVYFSGNQFFVYHNITKKVLFPRDVPYTPSTVISKEIDQYIHNMNKFIMTGEYNLNNPVHRAIVMKHILEQKATVDFNVVFL